MPQPTTFAPEFQPRSQPDNQINAHLSRLYPAQMRIKPVPRGPLGPSVASGTSALTPNAIQQLTLLAQGRRRSGAQGELRTASLEA